LADVSGVGEIDDPAVLVGKSVSVTWFGDTPVFARAASAEPDEGRPVAVMPPPAVVEPVAPPRRPKPKRKIEPREIPKDRDGKLAMLERWRRNGFFLPDDDAA
jgi:hypothetical protein